MVKQYINNTLIVWSEARLKYAPITVWYGKVFMSPTVDRLKAKTKKRKAEEQLHKEYLMRPMEKSNQATMLTKHGLLLSFKIKIYQY